MNVVLVGFMASGKTAVGRRVARRLGYGFFDTDQFIESEVGCTIAELFQHKGEAYFRKLESRLIGHLHKLENHLISTGGGILTTEGNLQALRGVGLTVFLNADKGEILERLARDTRRPKLKEGELEETVTRLLGERMARYCQSDVVIDTKGKSVNRVAGETIRAISLAGSPDSGAESQDPPAGQTDAAGGSGDGHGPAEAPTSAEEIESAEAPASVEEDDTAG